MNFTESFNEFSSRLGPTDIALYAGVGVVLWVLFKDQLSPVQKMLADLINKTKKSLPESVGAVIPEVSSSKENKDVFFDLIVSWKQTRDLAVKSGCNKAVEVADQMFPYLSPEVCKQEELSDE
jgi:hypothetical protein